MAMVSKRPTELMPKKKTLKKVKMKRRKKKRKMVKKTFYNYSCNKITDCTAKRKLERLQFSTSSSFVKI